MKIHDNAVWLVSVIILKLKNYYNLAGGMAQLIESLTSKCESVSSHPILPKKIV
jgi:hypothetical protein